MMKNFIFSGFLFCVFFYSVWFIQYGYVFGKSDVYNYVNMSLISLSGLNMRHFIIELFLYVFPLWFFCVILPCIYWYGIVYPMWKLLGSNSVFCFVFGTGSFGLFFIVGMWSQFLCIAFLMWALFYKNYVRLCFMLLSCLYLPSLFFYFVCCNYFMYGCIFMLILMLFNPALMFWDFNYWSPLLVFILYFCPVIWFKYWGKLSDCKIGRIFLLLLTWNSRGIIFLMPFLNIETRRFEKILIIIWWFMVHFIFILSFIHEALNLNVCCQTFSYSFI